MTSGCECGFVATSVQSVESRTNTSHTNNTERKYRVLRF